jgi:hypothetical protein
VNISPPPTLDPNWFYSTLAQSAAAIVGLLGGIFAARLQDQITAAREQRLKATPHLTNLHTVLVQLRGPMSEYLEHADQQLTLLRKAIAAGTKQLTAPIWYAHVEKSEPASVEASAGMVRVEEERTRDTQQILPLITAALASNSVRGIFELERGSQAIAGNLSHHTSGYAEQILVLARQASRELRVLALRSRTKPHWVLWACLAVLSLFGIIAPLMFLSSHNARAKAALITGFAAALVVLLGYLASQVRELGQATHWRSVLPPDDPELPN